METSENVCLEQEKDEPFISLTCFLALYINDELKKDNYKITEETLKSGIKEYHKLYWRSSLN